MKQICNKQVDEYNIYISQKKLRKDFQIYYTQIFNFLYILLSIL